MPRANRTSCRVTFGTSPIGATIVIFCSSFRETDNRRKTRLGDFWEDRYHGYWRKGKTIYDRENKVHE